MHVYIIAAFVLFPCTPSEEPPPTLQMPIFFYMYIYVLAYNLYPYLIYSTHTLYAVIDLIHAHADKLMH